MARDSGLSTFDWVRLRDSELVARGADPRDRVRFTGHTRCLPEPYLATIGTWGAYEVQELVNDAEPHKAVVPVSEAAYRRFKGRHRLLGRSQFARRHGPQPWARAEACFSAHERAQQRFDDYGGARGPIGVACDYARMERLCSPRGRSLGLLPVEIVLWTRVFDAMLAHHCFTTAEWLELADDDKLIVWRLGGDDGPWDIQAFLHDAPVRALLKRRFAAAS
jgi:hypothetical protein